MTKRNSKKASKPHPPPHTRDAGSARSRTRVAKNVPTSRPVRKRNKGRLAPSPDMAAIKAAYLEAMYGGHYHSVICETLKVKWRDISLELCRDPAFAEKFRDAEKVKNEVIQMRREEVADRRGMDGWEEPVFYQGIECGSIRRFSDALLLAQMKKEKPLDYADRHMHVGPGGGPVAWANVPPSPQSLKEWEDQIRSSLQAAGKTTGGDKP
mgnify:CR=1 FL=1